MFDMYTRLRTTEVPRVEVGCPQQLTAKEVEEYRLYSPHLKTRRKYTRLEKKVSLYGHSTAISIALLVYLFLG